MTADYERVKRYRKNTMRKLVEAHGGCCRVCGYSKCYRALEFHHIDPAAKSFSISGNRKVMGFDKLNKEAEKCLLVCANCHREIEDKLLNISLASGELVITLL